MECSIKRTFLERGQGRLESGSQAGAQEARKSEPHTFAEYAAGKLQVGDAVILSADRLGGGYTVKFMPKEFVEHHGQKKLGMDTVTEVHSDYVVLRKETRHMSYEQASKGEMVTKETIVPFRTITTIARFMEKDSE